MAVTIRHTWAAGICTVTRPALAALVAALALASGCASGSAGGVYGRSGGGRAVAPGYSETGMGSWYGADFNGRPTASGERFNMSDMTAAHKTLPFGTWIDVANLDNGRTVAVRVNDRGPFVRGRIVDVSRAAAEQLGMIATGTARVRITVTQAGGSGAAPAGAGGGGSPSGAYGANGYTVQIGSFATIDAANARAAQVDGARVVAAEADGDRVYRVFVGRYGDRDTADDAARSLRRRGFDTLVKTAE